MKLENFFKLGIGCWLAGIFLILSFWATIIYVAFHFISKYW